ncbi:MAG: transcriptional repressor NrdR [Proteobacteria bacterium]|nr:transcriptional repressor NrdR [Pseudomonadota bacterium]
MKCPACGDLGTRVINSRSAREDTEIRRRRLCDSCTHRFTTYERAEEALPMVVKKDDRREPWNRDKILHGLTKACEKRPISIDAVEKLARAIADEASASGATEISSQLIGERIMANLRELDEVAYVRFASVYRSFKDLNEFMEEVTLLVDERKSISKQEAP